MSRPLPSLLLLAGLAALAPATAAGQQLAYPPSARDSVVERYGSHQVAEPYRWMEDLDGPRVKSWVEAQNAVTFAYLGGLPLRDTLRARLTALWNYPRVGTPWREAGRIFFLENSGLQKQSVLFGLATAAGRPRELLDPNRLSPDGSVAVAQYSVPPNGRYLAYTTAAGGSDLQDIHLRVLATGRDLDEVVRRVKFSGISWTRDSRGFLYQRFRGSADSADLQAANTHHQVWYNAVGSSADRLVFERPNDPNDGVGGWVSDDGRWLFTSAAAGTSDNRLWMADLGSPASPDLGARLHAVAAEEDAINSPLGVVGGTLYLYTTWRAPKGRVVAVPLDDSTRSRWRDVVPEGPDAISEALLVGTRIAVVHLVDVQSRLRLFDLQGRNRGDVALPEVGTASGLSGRNDGSDFFFTFTSYLRPATVYRYDLVRRALTTFRATANPFDASGYETRATFYPSKDGTRVPIFITARKGFRLDGSHPTLLYGYGGFDVSIQPSYSPAVAALLERGGVYAVANLRGGAEYGEAWHHAGMRALKQNVFDDFIAAAEFLVREGYTTSARLAIQGASNGGLLVGAAMTQRPELFAVALPAVGVMDMLRYQKFTGGQCWAEEYGSSDDSSAADWLLRYSPLHNLRPGTCYPATLVTTADHDDRVVPSHSFKFTATLQAAQSCARPTLIRVETAGSHGYRPTDRVIAEIADEFAFALANLGEGTRR
jgi:prolyl oligopeptidase